MANCSSSSQFATAEPQYRKASVPQSSPLSILKHFLSSLACGGEVAFASIYAVNESRGSFRVLDAQGLGSDLFATCAPSRDWSTQDATSTRSPLYYDCLNDSEEDLPCDARLLKSAGIHTMLALPCIARGSLMGVLVYGLMAAPAAHLSLMLELEALAPQLAVLLLDLQASRDEARMHQRAAANGSSRKLHEVVWPSDDEVARAEEGSFASLLDEFLAVRILESSSEASYSRAGTLSGLSSS